MENLLCAQHPRQLFNPPDSPGSGYHHSPLVEHTAQRGGEMPRSRSEGMGWGAVAASTCPWPCGLDLRYHSAALPSGLRRFMVLPSREACFPGQASGRKHPACHHLLRAPPHLQPQGPLCSTSSFFLHTCGGRRVHTTLRVHICGVAEWGACDPDVTVPTGCRPDRGGERLKCVCV